MSELFETLKNACEFERGRLLNSRSSLGDWVGELSSSAVSTATAAYALHLFDAKKFQGEVLESLRWLKKTALDCGAWGDTPESPPNPSATILALCALRPYSGMQEFADIFERAKKYMGKFCDFSSPLALSKSILKIYGRDLTFSAPILAACASSGLLQGENPWRFVPRLPFEFAVLPSKFFGALRLPIVSYAIPALVCVGIARSARAGVFYKIEKQILENFLLSKIALMQPSSGGFLEAVPLSAFCAICLCEASKKEHSVCKNAIRFINSLRREDGSLAIDIDLRSWLTSLASLALSNDLTLKEKSTLRTLILSRNQKQTHPFTGAPKGAWAWTPADGGVPDADDTCAALCALKALDCDYCMEVDAGLQWLINLQNSDGGMPTFCKGWNLLPFDKSCADISAHALKAFKLWGDYAPQVMRVKIARAMLGLKRYLINSQSTDGSWNSLWFGDQDCENGLAPVYGTSIVLEHLGAGFADENFAVRGAQFLISSQNLDGAWGGRAGVKSKNLITARALCALANFPNFKEQIKCGARALLKFEPSQSDAVGLYFAKLWYSEILYAPILRLNALKALLRMENLFNDE